MNNHEELFTYLVGDRDSTKNDNESYLLGDRSTHKVTMISGEWGSGKTYFWNDIIKTKKHKNVYISLYGMDSISSIENELFIKAYNIGLGRSDEDRDLIEKTYSIFSTVVKGTVGLFNVTTNTFDDANTKEKYRKAISTIDGGLIICFDDFERKSSKIDLNDLFGFISNLSIKFNCKIVIILNSDSFEGEDKVVFSRVKEKTVNKYFSYSPSKAYLLNQIISANMTTLSPEVLSMILTLIEQTNLLNARVYEQIINNVVEYILMKGSIEPPLLKILILNTIYFNLYHDVIRVERFEPSSGFNEPIQSYANHGIVVIHSKVITNIMNIDRVVSNNMPLASYDTIDDFKNTLSSYFHVVSDPKYTERNKEFIKFIELNDYIYYISLYIYKYKIYEKNYMDYYDNITDVLKFIETGILIK